VRFLIAATLLMIGASGVRAQGGIVEGRATDARSAEGIPGVMIEVEGTTSRAIADTAGHYRIPGVTAGAHTVVARRVGYSPARQTVTVVDGQTATADLVLTPAAVALDQVVVTGTAGGERLRAIGNAVATIDAPDAVALSGAQTVSSLLNARAPGMVLNQVTGRLGAGPSIMIRGRSSIGLGNAPLIYIDGVRANNETGLGALGGGNGAAGSSVAGRLNDINPEDIESVEIIKGPAASTLYGTEASNGVIQIITKKGSGGAPRISLQVKQGAIWLRDAADRVPTNYMADSTGQIVAWNAVRQEAARGNPLFTTGHSSEYTGSLSGSYDKLRYYLSTSYQDDKGVEPNNYVKQFALHSNLNVPVGSKIDLATSLNFVDLHNHLGTDAGVSAMLGATVGHSLLQPAARGFGLGYPPELSWDLYDNAEDVNRFLASGTLNYRTTEWLTQRLVMGLDYAGNDSRALERYATPELAAFLTPTQAKGRIAQTLRRDINFTVDYSGTVTVPVRDGLTSASSVGLQAFRRQARVSSLGGRGFPAPGIELVSAAAVPLPSSQSQLVNTTVGAFVQERLAWNDRLFVTGALRVDNNSAFGEDFKWVTYPKADVSWVLSEEPFWGWDRVISTLRLRAAYGESGRAPAAFSALRTFRPITGPNGSNAVTPGSFGNANLKPERAKELEVGFEAGLFNRVSLDFTYFRKKTSDEILDQPIAPSTSFAGTIPVNLGRVDNNGFELRATVPVLTRESFDWQLVGSVATNKDVVRDLGGLSSEISSYGPSNQVGYPIGGIWSKRVVSAERDPVTKGATNVLCDGGAGQPPVDCSSAPFVFLGTTTPKWSGAIANTFTIARNLKLYALVDFQGGHIRLNRDALLRCTGAAGAPLCESNWYPERFSPVVLAENGGIIFATNTVDRYFERASFAKLREVSLTYSLPDRWIRALSDASITVSARELATWTGFTGTDPENSSQAVLPPLSHLTATLNIRF
jgi:TonB-linked SusC/RagA family outer membrane protein